ncbi:MAG: hypothetical protein J3K34DRAFT_407949 [Monoraphidium minutum]|nr:MAG: hypothetical protein J3K34DRAFT_407949 [Monoraphidium minutum]
MRTLLPCSDLVTPRWRCRAGALASRLRPRHALRRGNSRHSRAGRTPPLWSTHPPPQAQNRLRRMPARYPPRPHAPAAARHSSQQAPHVFHARRPVRLAAARRRHAAPRRRRGARCVAARRPALPPLRCAPALRPCAPYAPMPCTTRHKGWRI